MIYLLLAALIWGSSFIAGKYSYAMFDPAITVQLRLAIAAIFSLPAFFPAYRKIPSHLVKKMWLIACLVFPTVFMLQFIGLSFTSAASAVTMLGAEPLITVLVGVLFFKQRLKLIDILFGIVAFIGVALVVLGSEEQGDVSLLGCLMVLSGGFIFAFCLYMSKDVMKELKAVEFTNILIVLGTVTCVPMTLLFTQNWQINPSSEGIWGVLYLSVGCTWLAYILWNKGLQDVSANISAIFSALEPVFGVFLALLILGEHLSLVTAVGVALVIFSAMGSTLLPVWFRKWTSPKLQ